MTAPAVAETCRLIAGLVGSSTDAAPSGETLKAMASRVTRVPVSLCLGAEPAGLLTSLGEESRAEGNQVWVVADLDLTNVTELQARARRPFTGAALVAALYEQEGPAFVGSLRGGFALAIWDRRSHGLLLAVDQVGIKRLHYLETPTSIAFASRPSALPAAPFASGALDPGSIYHYLNFGYVPSPGSVFAGVRRLPPGHTLAAGEGGARVESYWDMAYPERPGSRSAAAATLYRVTEQAVARALDGIAPKHCGAFLSGGTDSSTVLGLMTRVTGERVGAFSIGFQERRYDEMSYAELAAKHFGAAHYTKIITPWAALAAVPHLVEAFDEPFGNNSALGTYFCAELARECGVTHLLAGDGGDEIFGGNERYRTDRIFALYHRVPALLRRGLLEPILLNLPDGAPGVIGRGQRYIRRASIPNPQRFYSYEFFVAQHASDLLAPELMQAVDAEAPWRLVEEHYGRVRAQAELNRLLYLDLKLTLGDNDILKVTRTAELAGVAPRFPLLDLALVEHTGTLPASFKVRGLEKRHLFKRAFRSLLPAETLAKRKHGFGVPVSDWLKTDPGFRDLTREMLLSTRATQRGYFRPGAVEGLLDRHASDETPFYGDILWMLLMLELWQRRHVDVPGAA